MCREEGSGVHALPEGGRWWEWVWASLDHAKKSDLSEYRDESITVHEGLCTAALLLDIPSGIADAMRVEELCGTQYLEYPDERRHGVVRKVVVREPTYCVHTLRIGTRHCGWMMVVTTKCTDWVCIAGVIEGTVKGWEGRQIGTGSRPSLRVMRPR